MTSPPTGEGAGAVLTAIVALVLVAAAALVAAIWSCWPAIVAWIGGY